MPHSQACIFHEKSFKILRTLSPNKIKCDFLKIGCLVLSAFLLGPTMGDKFAPQEPFVGRAAEAICSLLWKRHLTLHLSPPAAGYNSTHLEPLSRGAEQSSRVIILHNNGCSGKQETNIEYIPERLSWGAEVTGPGGGLQEGREEGWCRARITLVIQRGLCLVTFGKCFCLTTWCSVSLSHLYPLPCTCLGCRNLSWATRHLAGWGGVDFKAAPLGIFLGRKKVKHKWHGSGKELTGQHSI